MRESSDDHISAIMSWEIEKTWDKWNSNKWLELEKDNLLNLARGKTEQLEEEKLGERSRPILLFKCLKTLSEIWPNLECQIWAFLQGMEFVCELITEKVNLQSRVSLRSKT